MIPAEHDGSPTHKTHTQNFTQPSKKRQFYNFKAYFRVPLRLFNGPADMRAVVRGREGGGDEGAVDLHLPRCAQGCQNECLFGRLRTLSHPTATSTSTGVGATHQPCGRQGVGVAVSVRFAVGGGKHEFDEVLFLNTAVPAHAVQCAEQQVEPVVAERQFGGTYEKARISK